MKLSASAALLSPPSAASTRAAYPLGAGVLLSGDRAGCLQSAVGSNLARSLEDVRPAALEAALPERQPAPGWSTTRAGVRTLYARSAIHAWFGAVSRQPRLVV